jgi:hypothetical protein
MRDDGAIDRLPRVDVEVVRRAVQAFGTRNHQVVGEGDEAERRGKHVVARIVDVFSSADIAVVRESEPQKRLRR